jgi:acylphosphatase
MPARRFLISGRVQGVGFRYFAQRSAREVGVSGWARNLDDGRVEVHANGTPAQLEDFESRLRLGLVPPTSVQ